MQSECFTRLAVYSRSCATEVFGKGSPQLKVVTGYLSIEMAGYQLICMAGVSQEVYDATFSVLPQENLLLLCVDRYGSRVVDVVWRRSQVTRKEEIAALLLVHEEELSADFHGGIVLRNCDIAHFRKKQAGWLEGQRAASKKREMFQDILGDGDGDQGIAVGSGKKRKKNNSSSTEIEIEETTRKKAKHK